MRAGTRRQVLHSIAAGFFALGLAQRRAIASHWDLVPDPLGVLDLPPGFEYRALSAAGDPMDDGLETPDQHDGMGVVASANGGSLLTLVRNHEQEQGPEPARNAPHRSGYYDYGRGILPAVGGAVTIQYDLARRELVSSRLSLTGTLRNCAGGITPWGTWISCEESTARRNDTLERDHGYCFEVRPNAPLEAPKPLEAMGRFNHEAIAVDPRTGIVYLTEDRSDSLFYRFLPDRPGELSSGRLQALALQDLRCADTRNHAHHGFPMRQSLACKWIDLRDVHSPGDDLRVQGYSQGAACFSRGEGIWYSPDGIYFACTDGGPVQAGQIFRYAPGAPGDGGALELWLESTDRGILQNADNLTVTPSGLVFLGEDGPGPNRIVGVTPGGRPFVFARNAFNLSEFAGICMSPDGSTMFVNRYSPGVTFAITGPWNSLLEASLL